MLFRELLRNRDSVLHPTGLLNIAQFLKMLGIIWVVVDQSHRADAVESFNKHSLRIEICKSERTDDLLHSARLSESHDSIEKSLGYFQVIDEIDPSETDLIDLPCLICLVIYDCGHSAYYISILICKIELGITEFESTILFLVECIEIVPRHARNIVWITFIQFVSKSCKDLEVFLCRNCLDCYSHVR